MSHYRRNILIFMRCPSEYFAKWNFSIDISDKLVDAREVQKTSKRSALISGEIFYGKFTSATTKISTVEDSLLNSFGHHWVTQISSFPSYWM